MVEVVIVANVTVMGLLVGLLLLKLERSQFKQLAVAVVELVITATAVVAVKEVHPMELMVLEDPVVAVTTQATVVLLEGIMELVMVSEETHHLLLIELIHTDGVVIMVDLVLLECLGSNYLIIYNNITILE
ncbi:MAG: hypothetical protein CTY12_00220 [Methylotenera sp.]|nr:MAG: hypothetical protein CTY12_00220 [Methylotenera sp.]